MNTTGKHIGVWLLYIVGYSLIPSKGLTAWSDSVLRIAAAMLILQAGCWLERIRSRENACREP